MRISDFSFVLFGGYDDNVRLLGFNCLGLEMALLQMLYV